MTPEQLNWTDKQWAAHLGCAVSDVSRIKKSVTDNFIPVVCQGHNAGEYFCNIRKKHMVTSGNTCLLLWFSSSKCFKSYRDAQKYANEQFFQQIKLSYQMAKMYNLPNRALNMLHIR